MEEEFNLFDIMALPDVEQEEPTTPQQERSPSVMDSLLDPEAPKGEATELTATMMMAEDSEGIDTPISNTNPNKLKKTDLLQSDNMEVIRTYMRERYGQDMLDEYNTDERLMERFVDSMRFFNGNVLGTAGEATWVARASDEQKMAAADAYELFDRLGNLFTTGSLGDRMDGLKDYVFAAARDPSTYAGIFTGGAAKAATAGAQQGVKNGITMAAARAAREASKRGLSAEARKRAIEEAVTETIDEIGSRVLTDRTKNRLLKEAERNAIAAARTQLREGARRDAKNRLGRRAAIAGGVAGAGIDALIAGVQDSLIQNTFIEVGAQEEYSKAQTILSGALGGLISPAAQLLTAGVGKALGRQVRDVEIEVGKRLTRTKKSIQRTLSTKQDIERVKEVVSQVNSNWEEKIARGQEYDPYQVPVEILHDIVFGQNRDGKGGLAGIFLDKGLVLPADMRVADFFGDLIQDLPSESLEQINKNLTSLGLRFGELTELPTTLADIWAKDASRSGQILNVSARLRRMANEGVAAGRAALIDMAEGTEEALMEKSPEVAKQVANFSGLTQNLWRRLLVAAPETTAANLAGYFGYQLIRTPAQALNVAPLALPGLVRKHVLAPLTKDPVKRAAEIEAGDKMIRQAKAYASMIPVKLANMLDPFTTRANFDVLLNELPDAKKILRSSVTRGVETNSERFGFSGNKVVEGVERVANLGNRIALVEAQDSFTKSLSFMGELDTRLRLDYDVTLDDVMRSGDLSLLDNDLLYDIVTETQRSVFSLDLTREATNPNENLRFVAKIAEGVSNVPVLGNIIPFGRFINNVVALHYQIGVDGFKKPISDLMQKNLSYKTSEAFMMTLTAAGLAGAAMQYDKERRADNLAAYQVKVGGQIFDARNYFPISQFLVVGRMFNEIAENGEPDQDTLREFSKQMGIGTVIEDISFARAFDSFTNSVANITDPNVRQTFVKDIYKSVGGWASGFTRPLTTLNKAVGAVLGNDEVRDVRQAGSPNEMLFQQASKYTDNILELILDKVDQAEAADVAAGTPKVFATRQGPVREQNALLAMMGIKLQPGRTISETILDGLDYPRYMADVKTNNPKFDRYANQFITDNLNRRMEFMTTHPEWKSADDRMRYEMVRHQISEAQRDLKKSMRNIRVAPSEVYLEAVREEASRARRAARVYAAEKMKEQYGVEIPLSEMSFAEINKFMFYVDAFEQKRQLNIR